MKILWSFFGSPSVPHPRSSKHQFHTKGPLHFSPKNPSVQHTPQFHTKNPSVQHRKPLSSTQPSVRHQKPPQFNTSLSSTIRTPQFNTSHRQKNSWGVSWTESFSVLNWGVSGVELRGFWVLNWGVLWWKCVVLVLKWGACVELRGTQIIPKKWLAGFWIY